MTMDQSLPWSFSDSLLMEEGGTAGRHCSGRYVAGGREEGGTAALEGM
jgi:hypothetical protein